MSWCWYRHPCAPRPRWCWWCARQVALEARACVRLLEALWPTTVSLVTILCEPSAPRHKAHGQMLVEASARTKALLVPMVCKTSAPIITSMSLDCRWHLGAPRPRWCRYCASQVSPTAQGKGRSWSRHPRAPRHRWCWRCVRQVLPDAQPCA